MPCAIHAAFQPTFPAPSTTTRAGRTPGAPPSSTPAPALVAFEEVRADLGRHPTRDLAHRREQRQRAGLELYRLVRDPGHPVLEQCLGNLGIRGEVEVREHHQARSQVGELVGLGLLHLQHELGASPQLVGSRNHLRARTR